MTWRSASAGRRTSARQTSPATRRKGLNGAKEPRNLAEGLGAVKNSLLAQRLGGAEEPRDILVPPVMAERELPPAQASRFDIYSKFRLTADLGHLSERQKQMIPLLVEAAQIMDGLFWQQAFGDREALLNGIDDPKKRHFAELNYGPWDRLDGNEPFVEGYGPKPPGARFYPEDMTREEFEAWEQDGKDGEYSLVRRTADGIVVAGGVRAQTSADNQVPHCRSEPWKPSLLGTSGTFPNWSRYRRHQSRWLRGSHASVRVGTWDKCWPCNIG